MSQLVGVCVSLPNYSTFRDSKNVLLAIPAGLKSDVLFVVDNASNVGRRQKNQRSVFADDCCMWMSKASVTTRTFIIDDSRLNFAKIVDGKVSVKRSKMWHALEPQPPVEKLVVLVRSYATLKCGALSNLNHL